MSERYFNPHPSREAFAEFEKIHPTYWQPLEITTTVFLRQHYLSVCLAHRLSCFTPAFFGGAPFKKADALFDWAMDSLIFKELYCWCDHYNTITTSCKQLLWINNSKSRGNVPLVCYSAKGRLDLTVSGVPNHLPGSPYRDSFSGKLSHCFSEWRIHFA